jgi:hypothetical protein
MKKILLGTVLIFLLILMTGQVWADSMGGSTSGPLIDTSCNKSAYYGNGVQCYDSVQKKQYVGNGTGVTELGAASGNYIAQSEKAAASGVASLDGSSKVVQNPATQYLTPADGSANFAVKSTAYTIADISSNFAAKATTLAGYGITNTYTVAEASTNFAAKATTLAGYGITNTYTATEASGNFLATGFSYSKADTSSNFIAKTTSPTAGVFLQYVGTAWTNSVFLFPTSVCANGEILKASDGAGTMTCQSDATGGSPSFDTVGAGTNTGALVVGTGGTLGLSGTGTITANRIDQIAAAGDVVVGSAAKTPTVVTKGANNSVFGVDNAGTLGFYTTWMMSDSAAQFYNVAAPTKLVKIDPSNQTAGNTGTIQAPNGGTATLVAGTQAIVGANTGSASYTATLSAVDVSGTTSLKVPLTATTGPNTTEDASAQILVRSAVDNKLKVPLYGGFAPRYIDVSASWTLSRADTQSTTLVIDVSTTSAVDISINLPVILGRYTGCQFQSGIVNIIGDASGSLANSTSGKVGFHSTDGSQNLLLYDASGNSDSASLYKNVYVQNPSNEMVIAFWGKVVNTMAGAGSHYCVWAIKQVGTNKTTAGTSYLAGSL